VELKANIFDIQGLSVHDGPGCRTLIFMQGCTLNCNWCSNPEGINIKPTLLYNSDYCRLDGNCIKDCNFNAIEINNNKLLIDRSLCEKCNEYPCLNNCYTKALSISSSELSVNDLMKIVKRDRQFWGLEGGITFSGGEPLLQINFVEEVLKQSHEAYIHTAIETCGNIPWENYERVLPYLDWIFFDLKNPDADLHKEATGAKNNVIMRNLALLSQEFEGRLIVRIPVIPGFNTSPELLKRYVSFFKDHNISEVNILPLHHLGREKYSKLGRNYPMAIDNIPSETLMEEICNTLAYFGINCYQDSSTPF
jgi:glycyl-radical enzyme activating protein